MGCSRITELSSTAQVTRGVVGFLSSDNDAMTQKALELLQLFALGGSEVGGDTAVRLHILLWPETPIRDTSCCCHPLAWCPMFASRTKRARALCPVGPNPRGLHWHGKVLLRKGFLAPKQCLSFSQNTACHLQLTAHSQRKVLLRI